MTMLVTGGLGVNGAWVTRALLARGIRPVVVDARADFSLLTAAERDAITFIAGDFTDPAVLDAAFAETPAAVIHMAARVGNAEEDVPETVRVNVHGTALLLERARQAGVARFVYTSSRAVYGGLVGPYGPPEYRAVPEDHPCRPVRVYDVTKHAAEGIGRNYARKFGMEFVALRFAMIFGPGKTARHGGYGVLSRIIEGGIRHEPVRIAQGGDALDDMIYVADVADAVATAALHPKPGFDAYNISHGLGRSLHEMADAVRAVTGANDIAIGPGFDAIGLGVNYAGVLDNARAREDLGFSPRFGLRDAVEDYARSIRNTPLPPLCASKDL